MSLKVVFFDTGIKKIGGVSYSNKKELASKIFSNENEFWKYFSDGDYFFAHNYFSYDIQNITKIQQEDKKIVDTLYLHTLFCINQKSHKIQKTKDNDVIEDSKKCKKILEESYKNFCELPENIQNVLFSLLGKKTESRYFFDFFHVDNSL